MRSDWKQLRIRDLSKRFESGPPVLANVTLTFDRGSFVCVLGPSGSGKTTLIELIAGFDRPSAGTISYDDQPIAKPGPDRVVVFQDISNALFPWLTVIENVTFGLKTLVRSRLERDRIASNALDLVGLANDLHKFPSELSGGMKQRAQIARGLVMDPQILIMDEPFAALDAITRRRMQLELKRIWQTTGKTVIFVTHDIGEALNLATEIAVLSSGPEATILEVFSTGLPEERRPEAPQFVRAFKRIEALIEPPLQQEANARQAVAGTS